MGLSAVAWLATRQLSSPDMRVGILTGAARMSSMSSADPSLPMMGLFLLTWVVMMVAMMFPAVVPVAVTFDRWVRRTRPSRSPTVLFVGGYLLVWSVIGLVVYGATVYLQPLVSSGETAVRWGAGLLVVAGVYQFTPLKSVCLRQCQSPLAFLAQHAEQLRRGGLAPARVGVTHGLFCLGCCWALMLVLVLLGMMSLSWMAAVAGIIFLEKVLPYGSLVAVTVAVMLVGLGLVLLISPRNLPMLA
ncbi:MAG: DUF2182 domain-containing protein [Egibacteraceae bacterium]